MLLSTSGTGHQCWCVVPKALHQWKQRTCWQCHSDIPTVHKSARFHVESVDSLQVAKVWMGAVRKLFSYMSSLPCLIPLSHLSSYQTHLSTFPWFPISVWQLSHEISQPSYNVPMRSKSFPMIIFVFPKICYHPTPVDHSLTSIYSLLIDVLLYWVSSIFPFSLISSRGLSI